jgi:hypothetical protein
VFSPTSGVFGGISIVDRYPGRPGRARRGPRTEGEPTSGNGGEILLGDIQAEIALIAAEGLLVWNGRCRNGRKVWVITEKGRRLLEDDPET